MNYTKILHFHVLSCVYDIWRIIVLISSNIMTVTLATWIKASFEHQFSRSGPTFLQDCAARCRDVATELWNFRRDWSYRSGHHDDHLHPPLIPCPTISPSCTPSCNPHIRQLTSCDTDLSLPLSQPTSPLHAVSLGTTAWWWGWWGCRWWCDDDGEDDNASLPPVPLTHLPPSPYLIIVAASVDTKENSCPLVYFPSKPEIIQLSAGYWDKTSLTVHAKWRDSDHFRLFVYGPL